MTNGKKIKHKNLNEDILYLQIMIGETIIDNYANEQETLFNQIKDNPDYGNGWELSEVKTV